MKTSFAFLGIVVSTLFSSAMASAEFRLTVTHASISDGQTETVVPDDDVKEIGEQIVDELLTGASSRRMLREQDHRKLYTVSVDSFALIQAPTVMPCSQSGTQLVSHPGNCLVYKVSYDILIEGITAADFQDFVAGVPNSPTSTTLPMGQPFSPEDEVLLKGLISSLVISNCAAPIVLNGADSCAVAEVATKLVAIKAETGVDPHFKTFGGDWYDFHGGCDLVLIDVPDYDNQVGLAVNIRTTVRYAYSFIESLAIKVGEDILQVTSWGDYILNGISNADLEGATLNGLPVTREAISEKQFKFTVTLENGHHFTIKVFKDMISTSFDLPEEHNIIGLLGNRNGDRIARDGVTVINDPIEFGQEWQVQDTEHQLFQTVREPQFPAKCIMPDPVEREKRRLSATVSQEAAEVACSHIKDEHVRDMCIFDVISVDDLSVAAGAY